uniref:c-type cytochrome n=1 Tax=Roseovarius indicus TaxID=540747 RepID=UPI003B51B2C3
MRKTAFGLLAMALLAAPALAEDAGKGRETYWRYCASCHGENGDGTGPMRAVLTVQPKDLTQLAAENDGVFPLDRVIQRIDGRDPLVSHGSQMPVYGNFFDEGGEATLTAEDGTEIETSGAVADLIAYLKVLQDG